MYIINLPLYYWGRSIYAYITKIQNIQNRNQSMILKELFSNRKKITPEHNGDVVQQLRSIRAHIIVQSLID